MYLILGGNQNDLLFYQTKLKNTREIEIMNRFPAIVGTLYGEEIMLLSDIYSSYLTTSVLSYIIEKYF